MSASDKKQLRKAAMADGLTQKQMKEATEAQTAKRKKTIYTIVGVICAIAAIALLAWNGMSYFHRFAVAATVDGEDYKVPDLQYYYAMARNIEYQNYQYSLYFGSSYTNYDPTISDGAQFYNEAEGITYADYFRENAVENLRRVTALCKAAAAEGYTLSEDGQAQIDSTWESIDLWCAQNRASRSTYLVQVYGSGVTEEVFLRNFTNALLADEFQSNHQSDLTYSDADLLSYYNENPDTLDSYDYRYFFINGQAPNPTDENGNALTDENGTTITATAEEQAAAMAQAKEKADAALAEIENAEDREAAFIEAAPKYVAESSQAAYANESYSLNTAVYGSTISNSVYGSWLMDSSRLKNDVTVVESTTGYYVVLYLNRYRNDEPYTNIRHILILADTIDSTESDENGRPIPTQAAMDAAKAEAEALLEEWKAGEATASSFGALANEHSDDPGSNANGGMYNHVTKGTMFEGFDSWIFDPARQAGDTGLVENPQSGQQGWHVIYSNGINDPDWKTDARTAKENSDLTAWITELTDAVEAIPAKGLDYVGAANTAKPSATAEPSESPAE